MTFVEEPSGEGQLEFRIPVLEVTWISKPRSRFRFRRAFVEVKDPNGETHRLYEGDIYTIHPKIRISEFEWEK